jgi:hypothetical protein
MPSDGHLKGDPEGRTSFALLTFCKSARFVIQRPQMIVDSMRRPRSAAKYNPCGTLSGILVWIDVDAEVILRGYTFAQMLDLCTLKGYYN